MLRPSPRSRPQPRSSQIGSARCWARRRRRGVSTIRTLRSNTIALCRAGGARGHGAPGIGGSEDLPGRLMISRRRGLLLLTLLPGAHRNGRRANRAGAAIHIGRHDRPDGQRQRICGAAGFSCSSVTQAAPTSARRHWARLARCWNSLARLRRGCSRCLSPSTQRVIRRRLLAHTCAFDQRIIGLTGNDEQIARIAAIFGAQYFKVPGSDPKKYTIAHSALIYVIGPEGGIVTQFSNANDPADMARMLTALIK